MTTQFSRFPWLIVTSTPTRFIVPAQAHLFERYAPEVERHYIDVESDPVDTWGANVLSRWPSAGGGEFCVFGLDDYLPTGALNVDRFMLAARLLEVNSLDRFELGEGAHRKPGMIDMTTNGQHWLRYGKETPYSVSCQFSIWRVEVLTRLLRSCGSPWLFEKRKTVEAGCFKVHAPMRWNESSALSKRWPGMVNLTGMSESDVRELVVNKLVEESKLLK